MVNDPIELTLYLRRLFGCMQERKLSSSNLTSEDILRVFTSKYPDEYYQGEYTPSTTLQHVEEGLMSLALLGLVHVEGSSKKKQALTYSVTEQGKMFLRSPRSKK